MSYFLTISGSPSANSANSQLLAALGFLTERSVVAAPDISAFPVFQPGRVVSPEVKAFQGAVAGARGVIFSTPAYLHNLPAVLKNALEWLTNSGELYDKPVLVFTFTPHAPRGDRARQSLLWSLEALNARVVAEAGLYQSEITINEAGSIVEVDQRELLTEALGLLG